jgi:hypothetical protein
MCKLTWLTTSIENSTVIVWFPMENSVSPLVQVNDNAQKKLQFASLLTDYEANFLTTLIGLKLVLCSLSTLNLTFDLIMAYAIMRC